MAKQTTGTDYVLSVNTGTTGAPTFKVVLCQTTYQMTRATETVSSKSKCGLYSKVEKGEITVSVEGQFLEKDSTDTSILDYKQLVDLFNNQWGTDGYEWKLTPKVLDAEAEGKIVETFTGMISNLDTSLNVDEVGTVSFGVVVNGDVTTTNYQHTT